MKYAYFPGCSLSSTAVEYDLSLRAVCKELGIELEEIPDWVCCGATPAHATSHLLSIALPAKTLALAEKTGNSVAVACASCYSRMKCANHEISTDKQLRAEVAESLGQDYAGGVKVLHLIEILLNEYGLDKLQASMKKPLKDMRVACYYGCLLVRPPKVMQFDDPNHPMAMDRLIETTGATAINWEFKTECCGGALALARTDIVLKLAKDILDDAKLRGADVVAVACPLCSANLDVRQKEVEQKYSTRYDMPVLYFTQLLGLGLGLPAKALGLDKHMVDPLPLLKQKDVV